MTDHGIRSIGLLQSGGTIEKTYDAWGGALGLSHSVLDDMLAELELDRINLHRMRLMAKDSLDLTPDDHALIASTALDMAGRYDGVVVLHGTDRLVVTGELLHAQCGGRPASPIVLTGAMRPWILRTSDAKQNLTEALLAVQLLPPGVYVCMHNTVLTFPGVAKDTEALRFVRSIDIRQEIDA